MKSRTIPGTGFVKYEFMIVFVLDFGSRLQAT